MQPRREVEGFLEETIRLAERRIRRDMETGRENPEIILLEKRLIGIAQEGLKWNRLRFWRAKERRRGLFKTVMEMGDCAVEIYKQMALEVSNKPRVSQPIVKEIQ